MVREFAKPQEARAIEARARARSCGVRIAVVAEARRYCTPARSEPGTTYTGPAHETEKIVREGCGRAAERWEGYWPLRPSWRAGVIRHGSAVQLGYTLIERQAEAEKVSE